MTNDGPAAGRLVGVDELRLADASTFPGALAAMSLYPESQFEVVLVRGPNQRNDFHVDPYDELFIQIEGTIRVDTREPGTGLHQQLVGAGELYLVPACVPHSPLRPAGTWGLVVEVRRKPSEVEQVEWYCDRCDSLIEQATMSSSEMIEALGAVLAAFQANQERRTCKACGYVLQQPGPFALDGAR